MFHASADNAYYPPVSCSYPYYFVVAYFAEGNCATSSTGTINCVYCTPARSCGAYYPGTINCADYQPVPDHFTDVRSFCFTSGIDCSDCVTWFSLSNCRSCSCSCTADYYGRRNHSSCISRGQSS